MRACAYLLAVCAIACSGPRDETQAPASLADVPTTSPAPQYTPVQIEMKNVRLHAAEGIVLDVASLRGEMISRTPNRAPVFDDQASYILRVDSAVIAMDMASLTRLMNDHLFAYDGAPLDDITMEIDEGRLKQKAKLRKGVPIPISIKATVQPTADGRLLLKTEAVKAVGVPATSLLEFFGLELADLVNLKNRRGIEITGNDITISPGQILPPPEIRGRLTRVEIAGGRLIQTFSGPAKTALPPPPDTASRNYIFFSGSVIRFGRLTMSPARLQLIDEDPGDPFDFYPALYERQLVAGYSKNTPDGGLKTYMPDFADLARRR